MYSAKRNTLHSVGKIEQKFKIFFAVFYQKCFVKRAVIIISEKINFSPPTPLFLKYIKQNQSESIAQELVLKTHLRCEMIL